MNTLCLLRVCSSNSYCAVCYSFNCFALFCLVTAFAALPDRCKVFSLDCGRLDAETDADLCSIFSVATSCFSSWQIIAFRMQLILFWSTYCSRFS